MGCPTQHSALGVGRPPTAYDPTVAQPEKVCIIGAGSSGLTACQVLGSRGIPFDCFEKGSQVGGNWRYENDNGMSSAYRSLHINTSRAGDGLQDVADARSLPRLPGPLPGGRLLRRIRRPLRPAPRRSAFAPRCSAVEPAGGEWEVTVEGAGGNARRIATAPCSSPTVTTGIPAGPSRHSPVPRTSAASSCTSTTTASPTSCSGKRVLVLGIGNSAVDIAVESSRIADKTFLAMRRGAYGPAQVPERQADRRAPSPPWRRGCRCRCSASSGRGCSTSPSVR